MIPMLYPATETQFNTLGLGALADAVSCVVTSEKNLPPTLEMEYPISGALFYQIATERIIYAPTYGDNDQPFRIYSISKPINGIVTVKAAHVAELLSKTVMPNKVIPNATPTRIWQSIRANARPLPQFTFSSDIVDPPTIRADGEVVIPEPCSVMRVFIENEESIANLWKNGGFIYDKWNITYNDNVGDDSDFVIEYGRNMTGIEASADMTDVYTGIYPYWKPNYTDSYEILSNDPVIYASNVHDYASPMVKAMSFQDYYDENLSRSDLEDVIRTAATSYLESSQHVLKVSIKVDFLDLSRTDQYRSTPTPDVKLYDRVRVYYPELDVDISSQVVKTTYDVLGEKYDSIEVGEVEKNLATVISEIARRSVSI